MLRACARTANMVDTGVAFMRKTALKCPNCSAPQTEGAEVCQYCGTAFHSDALPVHTESADIEKSAALHQPLRTTPRKKTNGFAVFLVILLLAALTWAPIGIPGIYKSIQASQAEKVRGIGEAVAYQGTEFTLKAVNTSEGNSHDEPKSGCEYIIVTVQIRNTGKETISYYPQYIQMKNSQGQISDSVFSYEERDSALESGELAPGGSVSGTVVFEEPKGDESLTLQCRVPADSSGTRLQFRVR